MISTLTPTQIKKLQEIAKLAERDSCGATPKFCKEHCPIYVSFNIHKFIEDNGILCKTTICHSVLMWAAAQRISFMDRHNEVLNGTV